MTFFKDDPITLDLPASGVIPLGPRVEYASSGYVPPKIAERHTLTDPRTGVVYGRYTEDEILDSVSKTFATATTMKMTEREILPTERLLNEKIKSNPKQEVFHKDIFNIAKNLGTQSNTNVKMNQLWFDYMESGDDRLLLEIDEHKQANATLAKEIPDDFNDFGLLHETVRNVSEVGGQLVHMAKDISGKVVSGTAAGAATGAIVGGPPGAIGGAAVGGSASALGNTLEYSYRQMSGSIYSSLHNYQDEATGARLDPEISKQVAHTYGAISAVPETAADAIMVLLGGAGAIGKTSLGGVFKAAATEGGTELVQSLVESIALWDAKRRTAEKTGEEFTPQTFEEIYYNAKQNARAGILGGGGLVAAATGTGAAVRAPFKYSSEAYRAIEKRGKARKEAELVREAKINDAEAKAQVIKDKSTLPVPSVDPETEVQSEAAPLTTEEIDQAAQSRVVDGTDITDGDIDNLVVADPEMLDEQIDSLIGRSEASVSEAEIEFGGVLREILPEDQATAIESLLQARAASLGMSVESYMDKRGISITDQTSVDKKGTLANVLINDTTAIINAFQGANVTAIAHELGHIYRRDLEGEDLTAVQKWLGVDPWSKEWSVAHEEAFAEGWEKYLADGMAPTPEMETVFRQFTKWITNMYRTLVNTPMEIDIPPEVRQVFDNILASDPKTLEKNLEVDAIPVVLEKTVEQQAAQAEAVGDAETKFREAIAQSQDEATALRDYIKAQTKILRQLFDAGDKVGYKRGVAHMKAVIARSRVRSKMYKRHKYLRNKIVKTMKAALPKKSAGKLVGKMNVEAQEFVNEMFPILSTIASIKKSKALFAEVSDRGWTDLTEAELYAMQIVGQASVRNGETLIGLEDALKDLRSFIATGISNSPFVKNRIKAKSIAKAASFEAAGPVDVEGMLKAAAVTAEQAHRSRQKSKSFGEKIATLSLGKDFLFGWGGLLNIISAYSSKETGKSTISKALDMFPSRQQYQTDVRLAVEEMQKAYKEAYGIGDYKMNQKQNLDYLANIDIGLPALYNKAMVRQLWMYMQDPNLNERLENNGITLEVREAVNENMSDQDIAFANALRNMFSRDSEYKRNNAVYRRVFGVALPRIENYVPIASEPVGDMAARQDKPESMFMPDLHSSRTPTTASAIKARAKTDKAKLIINGDLGLYDGFTEEMAHFRAFAESVRLANAVMADRQLRDSIIFEYGPKTYKALMDSLAATAANGALGGTSIHAIDKFRSAFVSSTIGMSFSVMSKQMISSIQYWQKMPASAVGKGMIDFWKRPVRNFKELNRIDYIKNRVGNIDIDLKDITASRDYQKFRLNPTIRNFMTINVKLGDKAAIIMGGWGYAKYLQDSQGLTRSQAIKVMAAESDKTQQSSSLEERSRIQRGGTAWKMAATYSSGPIQAARQEVEAIRGMVSGRMTKKQGIKTLFIYHVLVPAMYSAAASVISGEDAEEAYKNAMVAIALGPLGSSYSIGRTITSAVKKVFGMKSYIDAGPFGDSVASVSKVAADIAEGDIGDISLDDGVAAVQGALVLTGRGLPLTRLSRIGENAIEGNIKGTVLGSKIKE